MDNYKSYFSRVKTYRLSQCKAERYAEFDCSLIPECGFVKLEPTSEWGCLVTLIFKVDVFPISMSDNISLGLLGVVAILL